MNAFLLFRISVVAPILLCLVAALYVQTVEPSLSSQWSDLLAWNGEGGLLPDGIEGASFLTKLLLVAAGVGMVLLLINQVLFFYYWRYSRIIYLMSCLGSYPFLLLSGLAITTPVEEVLFEMATFLSGIALALAYYSPVAERFVQADPPRSSVIPGSPPDSAVQ